MSPYFRIYYMDDGEGYIYSVKLMSNWKKGFCTLFPVLVAPFLSSCDFVSRDLDPIPVKVLDAINFIQSNLKNVLTIAALARRANLHLDYFSTLFHQATGERPLPYVQMKRIERAQYLLATSPLSYTKIAEETGFENPPYFFRIFKKITGLTPREYMTSPLSLLRIRVPWPYGAF